MEYYRTYEILINIAPNSNKFSLSLATFMCRIERQSTPAQAMDVMICQREA
jgi:hypothetical protein